MVGALDEVDGIPSNAPVRQWRYTSQEEPSYKTNLDRFLDAVMFKVTPQELENMTLQDFFATMHEASILGLKIELLNEQTLASEVFTFMPSISSLYLAYRQDVSN